MSTKKEYPNFLFKKVVSIPEPIIFEKSKKIDPIIENQLKNHTNLSKPKIAEKTRNIPQEASNTGARVAPFVTPIAAAGGMIPINGSLDAFDENITNASAIHNRPNIYIINEPGQPIVNPGDPTPLPTPYPDHQIQFTNNNIDNITEFQTSVENSEKWMDYLNNAYQHGDLSKEDYYSKMDIIQHHLDNLTDRYSEYSRTILYPEISDIKNSLKDNGQQIITNNETISTNQDTISHNNEKINSLYSETIRVADPTNPSVTEINELRTDILSDQNTIISNQNTIEDNVKTIATLNPDTDQERITQLLSQNQQLTTENQQLSQEISLHRENLFSLDQKEYELIQYELNNMQLNEQNQDYQEQIQYLTNENDKLHLKMVAMQQHTYELERPAIDYASKDTLNNVEYTEKNNELFESLMHRQEALHTDIENSKNVDSVLWDDSEMNRLRYEIESLAAQNPNQAHNWIETESSKTLADITTNNTRIAEINTEISSLNPANPTEASQISALETERSELVDENTMLNVKKTELDGMDHRLHEGQEANNIETHHDINVTETMAISIGITTGAIFGGAILGPFIGALLGKIIGYSIHFFKCLFTWKWKPMRSTPFVPPKIRTTALASCIGGFIGGAVNGGIVGSLGGPGGMVAGIILGGILGGLAGFCGGALGAWLMKKMVEGWRNMKRNAKLNAQNNPVEIKKPEIKTEIKQDKLV